MKHSDEWFTLRNVPLLTRMIVSDKEFDANFEKLNKTFGHYRFSCEQADKLPLQNQMIDKIKNNVVVD